MSKDIFSETLDTLDDIKSISTCFSNSKLYELDKEAKERLLHDVVKLRRMVIGTTKCTESERTRLVTSTGQEGSAVRSLNNLQARIDILDSKIKEAEHLLEDQEQKQALEEANEGLNVAKKRLIAKREMVNAQEKALIAVRGELSVCLKLGTASSVSEFDDEERVHEAFEQLPTPLKYLYGQLRNTKKLYFLPIEISIASKMKPRSGLEAPVSEAASLPGKKIKSGDKKVKYGPGEKRRKRWFESIIGKEALSHEDWMLHQRSRSTYYPIPAGHKNPEEAHVKKYQLLMKFLDNSEKQHTVKKKHRSKKSKKKIHSVSLHGEPTSAPLFSLPVPEGDLYLEVKFFDKEVEVAVLNFHFLAGKVYVSSSPDWSLSKTLQPQIPPPCQSSKSITSNYGYPFDWAQELCGMELMKEMVEDPDQIRKINEAMIEQQEYLKNFLLHIRHQANDLRTFHSGLVSIKGRVSESSRKDNEKTKVVYIRQISPEKLKVKFSMKRSRKHRVIQHSYATGWWTVITKQLKPEDIAEEARNQTIDCVDTSKAALTRVRFYPNSSVRQTSQKSEIQKGEIYYQQLSPICKMPLKLEASTKLKENSTDSPVCLSGPLRSSDLIKIQESDEKVDMISGKMFVQRKNKIPKKYQGLLPLDYQKRFFPFRLHCKQQPVLPDILIPKGQEHLYKVYRIILQRGYIQLSVLFQVNLVQPLLPTLTVEGVYGSSEFGKRTSGEQGKESRDRLNLMDGRRQGEHVKLEREKILKQESEALKIRENYDQVASQLEKLPSDQEKTKQKRVPEFFCPEAKHWMTLKLACLDRTSPEDCVKRMEELLKEWCEQHATGVKALTEFLESGNKGKTKESSHGKSSKPPKEIRREKRNLGEGKVLVNDEELEQGEIPTIPSKHTTGRRHGRESGGSRSHERQRSRSPSRLRASQGGEGRDLSARGRRMSSPRQTTPGSRQPMWSGHMRMDTEPHSDRRSNSANRIRRI